jgi:hypothetical protein
MAVSEPLLPVPEPAEGGMHLSEQTVLACQEPSEGELAHGGQLS